ncbi:MAG TPA: DNA alkylation repair protein [Miltoncostaeaceae bacterium]|nr:DNA alkylation repair protein [Miltoncostaeaceae bacterium]
MTEGSKAADARTVRAALAELADPERAAWTAPYLGVVPGGYGEGDVLLGIPVPGQRRVARTARDLPLEEAATLLASPVHEHRFTALVVLVDRYRRSRDPALRAGLSRFYLGHRGGVDNWDLVDTSAPDLLGGELVDGDRTILGELAGAERLWDRRIAVVSTLALIRQGELDETFALAERVMADPHHLIHKAVGWMLREAGKRDERALVAFLETHRAGMPRTMLRYAIERLSPERRAALMARA